jgi:hypothetical protein
MVVPGTEPTTLDPNKPLPLLLSPLFLLPPWSARAVMESNELMAPSFIQFFMA